MARTAHLYLMTDKGVRGPFSAYRLHEMVQRGSINGETKVSPDGLRWLKAEQIKGLLRPFTRAVEQKGDKHVPVTPARPELREILERIEGSVAKARIFFNGTVSAAVMLSLFAMFGATYAIINYLLPDSPVMVSFLASLPPALLVAAAVGQAAGNLILGRFCRVTVEERRCLAYHVPWNRVPGRWPAYLRNWVYGGDWLVAGDAPEMLPYVRAFITGEAPASIEEELDIWAGLLTGSGAGCREAGHSVRELACVESLPEWTRGIDPGTALGELESQLGNVARDWALCLLRRAGGRMPELDRVFAERGLSGVAFEFHYSILHDGREALLVMIRPAKLSVADLKTEPAKAA